MIRLDTDPGAEGRVLVEARFEGALATTSSLRFAPAHEAHVEAFSARDSMGEVEVRAVTEGSVTRWSLARRAKGPLELRYHVTFGAKPDPYAPYAETIELSVGGEDVLLLPETEESFPVELRLKAGGIASGGASSFALGKDQHVTATTRDLRAAYFFAGDVGTAIFHGSDGNDFGAWLGSTSFDPRWVSAEIAGIRSAVDAYVGRTTSLGTPPVSVLFTATRKDGPPIVVASRTRGLVVSVGRRAPWTPAVRVLATQALVERYVGGFLWIGNREEPASGAFFSEGFSRAIAREVLVESSWISRVDRATELNTLLSTLAFPTDERALVMARGALAATALDVALRKSSGGQRSLKTFLRERLAQAANEKKDTLTREDFVSHVRESGGETAARELVASLDHGAEATLPNDLGGPCFRLVRRELVPFDLGFVTSSGEVSTVESVKAGSRAEGAGLRVGDVVSELHYEPGIGSVPVTLTVVRKERKVPLRFLPIGPSKPGRRFERIAGLPDERC